MAYTTISKSTDHFNTKTYSGNSGTQNITGIGFQPDMVWTKKRDGTDDHNIFDAVRGVTKEIRPNKSDYEDTASNGLTAFGTDGYTIGDWGLMNQGHTYVSWNWRAGAGAGSSNTDGSINTTSTSVNTTSGFSISKYTGTGSVATIGHGLGVVPKMIWVKRLDSSSDWRIYHHSNGNTHQMFLNTDGNKDDDNTIWNDTSPTSSVFTVGTNTGSNANGGTYVAYCFAEKMGFSRFGSYLGNGNADASFIYTGFRPALIIGKALTANYDWWMLDTKRDTHNSGDTVLYPNANAGDASNTVLDIVSNGFKMRNSNIQFCQSGTSYIYMAWAEASLVGSNNEPCKAR